MEEEINNISDYDEVDYAYKAYINTKAREREMERRIDKEGVLLTGRTRLENVESDSNSIKGLLHDYIKIKSDRMFNNLFVTWTMRYYANMRHYENKLYPNTGIRVEQRVSFTIFPTA